MENPSSVESSLPDYFPSSRVGYYEPRPLGQGTRMCVHASVNDGPTVLRAPKTRESDMFEASRDTGEAFVNGSDDPRIAPITQRDMRVQDFLNMHIGRNMAPVLPFVDTDMRGEIRVYSTQRRISVAKDLSHTWGDPTIDMDRSVRRSFARFVNGTRELVQERHLIPDLVGHGNVVLTEDGNVVLVDVNNVRPWLDDKHWCTAEMTQDLWEAMIDRNGGVILRDFLAPGYVDELGQPIGDASLFQLKQWETHLARHKDSALTESRSLLEIDNDPCYVVIDAEINMWRDRILTFMLHGDLKVPRNAKGKALARSS